jgi:AcrR family transcriptional regulator
MLNRERVLRAAMELADAHGIESLTMRELGRRLGVEAASLYNHVDGKGDLLDGMAEIVAGEIDVPSDDVDWKEAMRRRAVSARGVFSRHPWASGLLDSSERMGPGRLSYVDGVLGTLLRAGFSPWGAANAWLVIDSYLYGFERQRANLAPGKDAETTEVAEEILETVAADAYPSLTAVAAEFAVKPYDEAAVFELGLGLILDGLQRQLESASAGT